MTINLYLYDIVNIFCVILSYEIYKQNYKDKIYTNNNRITTIFSTFFKSHKDCRFNTIKYSLKYDYQNRIMKKYNI